MLKRFMGVEGGLVYTYSPTIVGAGHIPAKCPRQHLMPEANAYQWDMLLRETLHKRGQGDNPAGIVINTEAAAANQVSITFIE
ncbi:hypothetical protein JCM19237_5274 [Photobacterium aphoticum]|uniref:Uncharacterized protein n=1 Tax=Photobacterium aphoticum TaxID=754436 RepID=A0A090QHH8_9GAMM|nr:hypothetical protein JCM19237_5274 [Photobacterium aphoticum]